MTSAQKIIKYLAIAFALFLIVTIVSTILGAFYALSGFLGLKQERKTESGQMNITTFENNNVTTLEIDVAYSNLTIKTGDFLRCDTNNSNIRCKQGNQKLQIKEKSHSWFSNKENQELIIYVPEALEFEKVKINTGAGKIGIENLTTDHLEIKLGAGKTEIENLTVLEDCDIEGGAGTINILAGTIHNLDLDVGVGQASLCMNLLGKSDIDAGIGKLDIDLQKAKEDYKIEVDKGLGSIRIDGEEVTDSRIYGNGENFIDIDGGVGSIRVDFTK